MGKKPFVALIGLVWAGIALTGCGECCRNCHNKYNATPAFPTRTTKNDNGAPVSSGTMVGDSGAPKMTDMSTGTTGNYSTTGSDSLRRTNSTTTAPPAGDYRFAPTGTRPLSQDSLRPDDRMPGAGAPPPPATFSSRGDEGLPSTSRSLPGATTDNSGLTMPPPPVRNTSMPPAPKNSSGFAPLPSGSSAPPPPPPPGATSSMDSPTALPPIGGGK
jgi:hypothetical protein